jgi:GntR family transcriptional regulator
MFELPGGSEPIYRQLAVAIKEAIQDGLYQPGDQLPTVRAVASRLLLNPNTVARAYQELEKERVIQTIVGRGSFVADVDESPRRLQALIVESLNKLREMGWSAAELEAWCVRVIRVLDEEEP